MDYKNKDDVDTYRKCKELYSNYKYKNKETEIKNIDKHSIVINEILENIRELNGE